MTPFWRRATGLSFIHKSYRPIVCQKQALKDFGGFRSDGWQSVPRIKEDPEEVSLKLFDALLTHKQEIASSLDAPFIILPFLLVL
ncbi:MAG: hypothetical protein A2X46_04545 [Lentisphaerae bacterium GWF2_57_35]|nr:MAG: hypothetical protein A2X46_04545 [Lentisphaerae bacterium GWF2_57_35]